jgi:hypothetical protein
MNPSIRQRYEERQRIVQPVPLAASEGEWFVREMGAAEFVAFNQAYEEHLKAGKHLAHFAVYGACDQDGGRLFETADIDWIIEHVPGWVLGEVWATGARLNHLTKNADEGLEKNSPTTRSESSS